MIATTTGRKVFVTLNNLLLIVVALTMVLPLLNVLAVSFTTDLESYETTIKLFPREFSIVGYRTLFERVAILTPLINNIIVTLVGTLLHVLFCAMAGYVLAKTNFLGKALLIVFVAIPMMIPFELIIIPFYVTIKKLGLMDTLAALIVTGMVSTFSILLMRNYFEEVPKSLEEAAVIDGAGELKIFFQIFFPLAAPGIATITIFEFVSRWNHFLTAVLFINSPEKYTLQIALRSLVISQELTSSTQSVANNARMAGIVIAVIPLVLVYVFFQKYFIKGLKMGAVKE